VLFDFLSLMVLPLNSLLGAALWFGFFTDYEWDSTTANVLFPLVAGGIAVLSLVALKLARPAERSQRLRAWACCLPSLLGGLSFLFAAVLFCAPVLPAVFWFSEQSSAVLIQRAPSPGGGKTAEVIFYPVGAYSGGNGRIAVFIKYNWLPLVRRQVYFRGDSRADKTTSNYLTWQGTDAILLEEQGAPVRFGAVRWETPFIIRVPLYWLRHVVSAWIAPDRPRVRDFRVYLRTVAQRTDALGLRMGTRLQPERIRCTDTRHV
jgi:hypothetical protein